MSAALLTKHLCAPETCPHVKRLRARLKQLEVTTLLEKLSARQAFILREYARGLGTHEIAAKLKISPKSVSSYRARLFDNMGFKTRQDLVEFCWRNEIVQ